MIYLELFFEFFKIGLFTFGGGYGAIPLIRDCGIKNGWFTDEVFSDIVAISESTPGPIMVNAATFVGNTEGGVLGAAAATLGVILPSFIIILFISAILKKFINNKFVSSAMSGIKPCISGIILATGVYMALSAIFNVNSTVCADYEMLFIFGILGMVYVGYYVVRKKAVPPIALICTAALTGIVINL